MIFRFIKNYFKRKGTKISPLAILTDVTFIDEKSIFVGKFAKSERSKIGRCTTIGTFTAVYDCEIGAFCSIARDCYIGGAKHPIEYVSSSACFHLKENYTGKCYNSTNYNWKTRTKIGNDVWIGAKSIIKGGITIGDGAVIGSGSVVTHDVGPYEIWAGNPARFIRKRFDDKIIDNLLEIKWWEWNEEKLSKCGKYFDNPDLFIQNINKI